MINFSIPWWSFLVIVSEISFGAKRLILFKIRKNCGFSIFFPKSMKIDQMKENLNMGIQKSMGEIASRVVGSFLPFYKRGFRLTENI